MKHNIRCGVCNKFITEEDVLDDGLCGECAERLDWLASHRLFRWRMASHRLFRWRMATYALAIINLVLIFWR